MTMKKLREYMDRVAGDHEKEAEIHEILGHALMKLKAHDEHDFVQMMLKVHCVAYGPHFDDYMAKKAVEAMRNVDGSTGEHWTREQTDRVAEEQGIHCKADWYYTLNMFWSDYSNIFGNDTGMYIRLAKAYITDPDAEEGKVFKLYLAGH